MVKAQGWRKDFKIGGNKGIGMLHNLMGTGLKNKIMNGKNKYQGPVKTAGDFSISGCYCCQLVLSAVTETKI